jgi:hypothetical protein
MKIILENVGAALAAKYKDIRFAVKTAPTKMPSWQASRLLVNSAWHAGVRVQVSGNRIE